MNETGGHMSLWLDSYCGYEGNENIITMEDNQETKEIKMRHMLVHLAMDVFYKMRLSQRYDFLKDAVKQFDKVGLNNCKFTEDHILLLPYLKGNIADMTIHDIYIAANNELNRHQELVCNSNRNRYSYNGKTIKNISPKLNISNIDFTLNQYIEIIDSMSNYLISKSSYGLLHSIKREKINSGLYPNVTLYESANRILTDLVIIKGIRMLLHGHKENIDYREYKVNYGNGAGQEYDIEAIENSNKLLGEAFNVSKSLFKMKRKKTEMKLKRESNLKYDLVIIYNKDADPSERYIDLVDGITYIAVDMQDNEFALAVHGEGKYCKDQ